MLRMYVYDGCSTCRNAARFLDEHEIPYQLIPIRTTPPTRKELREMVDHYGGNIGRLFNTSGTDYRSLGLKTRMRLLTEPQKINLLVQNENLVRRPFLIGNEIGLVGFREEEWGGALL